MKEMKAIRPERGVRLTRVAACVRFVYNYMLKLRSDTWYFRATRIGYPEMASALEVIRGLPQYRFLLEAPAKSLNEALIDLEDDFRAFYAGHSHYPRFRGMSEPEPELFESREYPIKNRCCDCGYFLDQVPRNAEWTCPKCGVIHQTLENTASNVKAVRLALAANLDLLDAITREPP